jgi:hypothetical protein
MPQPNLLDQYRERAFGIYTHVLNKDGRGVNSPFDRMEQR